MLDLNGNRVSDITPLKGLSNLTQLDLHDNQISDVTSLKDLVNLTVLNLSSNHITDFSPIAGLVANLVLYDTSNQTKLAFKSEDVNRDGVVNIIDLTLVASYLQSADLATLAQSGIHPDVNDDGIVDIRDLVFVAAGINPAAPAPMLRRNPTQGTNLTVVNLEQWIQLAKQLDIQEPQLQKGTAVLESLLAMLILADRLPEETSLLANYPNPFNPETWIPYQLATPAEVSISIYSLNGKRVRRLALGHLPAGVYHRKSRAAYWDGRNEFGELVASGVYFYTLTADDFTATGKMLIMK